MGNYQPLYILRIEHNYFDENGLPRYPVLYIPFGNELVASSRAAVSADFDE